MFAIIIILSNSNFFQVSYLKMAPTICFSRPRFTYTTGSTLCSKAAKGTNFLQSSVRVNWSQSGHSLGTSCWQSHSHPARFGGEGGVPGHEPTGGKGGDGARVTCWLLYCWSLTSCSPHFSGSFRTK